MKGSQMEDEERREEKEEKNWRLKPIAFQVNNILWYVLNVGIIFTLIQDTEHEAQVEKIWACYGKDSQVGFLILCQSGNCDISHQSLP